MSNRQQVTIEAEGFSVGYDGNVVLSTGKVELTGNVIALAGHNGAGKSTFMKALLGLLPPESGQLRARNANTGELLRPERHMAFCPETGSVFSDITVKEYLKLWCRLKAPRGNYFQQEGAELLEVLELYPLLPKKGRELSKGQKQRVQTAAGFFTNPLFFLFDEPFDGLDVQRTHELMNIIRERSPNIAFLVSSHRMDVVERLADRVLVLQEGKVKTYGPTNEVSRHLCERMFVIEDCSAPEILREKLEANFPESFVYQLGESIRFASSGTSQEELLGFIRQVDTNGARMSEVSPTLTDAMSLHLRLLKQDSEIK
ncbi:MAG: ABC transporter ATP-binding protein [Bdellovibrionales bacterium]|nr:ABC transporter ATP-binding protein [Bdellovibrionales bacterium]